jgi:hypothetical protein
VFEGCHVLVNICLTPTCTNRHVAEDRNKLKCLNWMAIQSQEVVILVPALTPLFVALSEPKSSRCVNTSMCAQIYIYIYMYIYIYIYIYNLAALSRPFGRSGE